tara:strand:- start:2788 stop:3057 length:270 start_codon:yes stop_codon:yes gene_type:complete
MIYRVVKATVSQAADQLKANSPPTAAKFRHTAVTHGDDAGIRLKYLNRSARHDKLELTAIYQHAEDALWHKESGNNTNTNRSTTQTADT